MTVNWKTWNPNAVGLGGAALVFLLTGSLYLPLLLMGVLLAGGFFGAREGYRLATR